NFEWKSGYGPRFGLISVDRETQSRTVKLGGEFYGEIAREGGLRAALLSAYLERACAGPP
ncbi:MAG: family 1 glycosylhydrolase, partial [Vicinamibacteria bacterium]